MAWNCITVHGSASGRRPTLVLLHGGGSTIESTFGRILPQFAKTRRVIAVESQAHGHTEDIDRPLSFDQDADDVAAMLKQLQIERADLMGFSNGGMMQVTIRHPHVVNRLVLASTPYRRDGMQPGFFEALRRASLDDMPQPLKEAFLKANPDPEALKAMFDRDHARMLAFEDFRDSDIRGIQTPALVLDGDADVVRPEHALALSRLLPHARLAIQPGGHGEYLGEVCTTDRNSNIPALMATMIEWFLDAPIHET
jgi:pimeloyl-ACP methyl ester carboxylesterase